MVEENKKEGYSNLADDERDQPVRTRAEEIVAVLARYAAAGGPTSSAAFQRRLETYYEARDRMVAADPAAGVVGDYLEWAFYAHSTNAEGFEFERQSSPFGKSISETTPGAAIQIAQQRTVAALKEIHNALDALDHLISRSWLDEPLPRGRGRPAEYDRAVYDRSAARIPGFESPSERARVAAEEGLMEGAYSDKEQSYKDWERKKRQRKRDK